ncbi:glycerophosphocholine cholinephosphodiesterase ENPP6-like [Tubulanus polymorphus]|uniref:glycerophosphocholine cholinephosphodiesterase ENPP6-like n=1 Tax=Tubulanus polymorphus TaxID=672921 RepID=UPI003DA58545
MNAADTTTNATYDVRQPVGRHTSSMARYLCPYFLCMLLLAYLQHTLAAPAASPSNSHNNNNNNNNNKLLVLLFDGLRWDYVADDDRSLPGFATVFKNGVKADHLRPVFPTLCYPNLYSLATGLYPESHGMIGNYMYDSVEDEHFKAKSTKSFWWNGAEPIWITAKKQGKRSGWYYWPGCEVKIHGYTPDLCKPYYYYPSKKDVSSAVLDAVTRLRDDSLDIAGVYSEVLDVTGHRHASDSSQMRTALSDVDSIVILAVAEIKKHGLQNSVNLMIVSDHGTTPVSLSRVINLRELVKESQVDRMLDGGPYVNIWPAQNQLKQVYTILKYSKEPMTVYLKEDLPERWHYKNSARVAPITVVADPGWYIISHHKGFPMYTSNRYPAAAVHGYDNQHPDMWGMFAATGPDFKRGLKVGGVSIVDVYALMCRSVGLAPAHNNATWSNVAQLIDDDDENHSISSAVADPKYDVVKATSVAASSPDSTRFRSVVLMTVFSVLAAVAGRLV